MTYLENSKQYTGSDLENIFFRPMLTGESAQDLGVRVLYNMPQPTHVQLWDGQRNILQKFTSAGWAGGKAATKYEKTVNLNRVKAELGFSAANYFSMVYEKVSSLVNTHMDDLSGTELEQAETALFKQALAENIRVTMWIGDTSAASGYNTFDGLLKRINGLVDDDGVYNFSYQAAALEDPAYVVELFDKLWAGADPRIPGLKADDRLAYFVSSDIYRRYEDIFPILTSYPELENYLSPFMDAWLGGAAEQLMGQIASAKIPLSRMISPQLYWVMSDSEFTLDINNPEEPKILCVGNNPDRQNIYGAALGLYNSRIVKLINKKGMLKSSVIIDELPTIYFKGLDNLIATARSNKVAVCLGFQDFSQLVRDYGDKEAKVVMNTVGNIFSGQVVGETAKTLSERFGKVLQKRQSISINRQDVSTSINTQMDALIPPSKISGLTQGMFVGSVSDNFNERIEQKIFHCEIVVDAEKVKREERAYKKIPVITDFTDEDGNDRMKETVQANYRRIKEEVKQIVQEELERIAGDDNLKYLLQQK